MPENIQSQGKATLLSKVSYTPAHTLCLEIGQRERNPICVSLTDFSYLAPTTEALGVSLIHSANLPWTSLVSTGPSPMLGDAGTWLRVTSARPNSRGVRLGDTEPDTERAGLEAGTGTGRAQGGGEALPGAAGWASQGEGYWCWVWKVSGKRVGSGHA